MPAREDGGEDLLDDLGLADDGPAKLLGDLIACLVELSQIFGDAIGGNREPSWGCGEATVLPGSL